MVAPAPDSQRTVINDLPPEVRTACQLTRSNISYDIQNLPAAITGRLQVLIMFLGSEPHNLEALDAQFGKLTSIFQEKWGRYAEYVFDQLIPKLEQELRRHLGSDTVMIDLDTLVGRHNEGDIIEINRKRDLLSQTVRHWNGIDYVDPQEVVVALRLMYEVIDSLLAPGENLYTPTFDKLELDFSKHRAWLEKYWNWKGIPREHWPGVSTQISLEAEHITSGRQPNDGC